MKKNIVKGIERATLCTVHELLYYREWLDPRNGKCQVLCELLSLNAYTLENSKKIMDYVLNSITKQITSGSSGTELKYGHLC